MIRMPSGPRASTAGLYRALLAVLIGLACTGPSIADPSKAVVSIQGSTVFNARLIEPNRRQIEAMSERRLAVVPNKSIHGLIALLEGRADFAMISSTLESEIASLRRAKPTLPVDKLKPHEISRTRIAFARNPGNPVTNLTIAQVRAILLGEIKYWSEIGGMDLPITVVSVQPGGGVPTTVRSQILDGRAFTPHRLIEVEAARHVIQVVRQEPGAFGVAQLALIDPKSAPEISTDKPVEQHLVLVTLGEPSSDQVAVLQAIRNIAASSRH